MYFPINAAVLGSFQGWSARKTGDENVERSYRTARVILATAVI